MYDRNNIMIAPNTNNTAPNMRAPKRRVILLTKSKRAICMRSSICCFKSMQI